MASQRSYTWPVIAVICACLLLIVALPSGAKQWAPAFLRSPSLHFGLDLAGGTQLDFRISERELDEQIASVTQQLQIARSGNASNEELTLLQQELDVLMEQKRNLVESIRTVLERRINALGVSEAVITPSYVGDEKHLLVDCPGVVNVQQCIETVGKTIQLEFKEEFNEPTAEFEDEVRNHAVEIHLRVTEGEEELSVIGQDLSGELGISYNDTIAYFEDELPTGLVVAKDMSTDDPPRLIESAVQVPRTNQEGETEYQEVPGLFIMEVARPMTSTGRIIEDAPTAFEILESENENVQYTSHIDTFLDQTVETRIISSIKAMQPGDLRVTEMDDGSAVVVFLRSFVPGDERMAASHILVSYEDAVSAGENVNRNKGDAQVLANQIIERINAGENFETLARELSDGPSGEQGGSLGEFGRGAMVGSFEQAAFALEEGQITQQPVETQFGYHIIRSDSAPESQPDTASYDKLTVTGESAYQQGESFIEQMQSGDVTQEQNVYFLRTLFFSLLPTGWKDTPLDGKHFRSATVTQDPTSRVPVVQISFDAEGARLFQELTKRNVNKQLAIFVGGQLVSAPVVQQEITGGTAVISGQANIREAQQLARDLNTGAIPAPIYLSGQRTVEATLGANALQTSLQAALIGILILMMYMIVTYRLLGLLADIALACYALIFYALLKLPLFLFSDNHIVLTLAGMAGIILSIGMAVDANVLIFERMKEELKKGKMLKTAAHTGFERAWPSIRDGNVSTFITCSILFLIGTSIVRGFAVTLGMGVLISMFSAIVVTRWLIAKIAESPLASRMELFGVKNDRS